MLKKVVSILILFTLFLNAASFDQKVANIIGYDSFNENRGLINHIFSNKSAYYQYGKLNYVSVMEKLKDNGLLKVSLSSPEDVLITFEISNAPIKSMKIIADSLKKLGYYHYFTKNLVYNHDKSIIWVISLKTEAAIDPLMLSKELAQNNCQFIDIVNEGYTTWKYVINTSNAILSKADKMIAGEKIDFRKPLSPYLVSIEKASNLTVVSKPGNQWFPNIVFYDKDLNILDIVKEDKKSASLRLTIPENTTYVKIDDLYMLENIRRGLSVIIKE